MRYVVLSFDDGRKDFFTQAFPILQKYGLPATLNVITNYADDTTQHNSALLGSMSWPDLETCRNHGIEIANHSANHTNQISEIIRGAKRLQSQFHSGEAFGFSSPFSGICKKNLKEWIPLIDDGILCYIRSGNPLRQQNFYYKLLYFLYRFTNSSWAYYLFNKRNYIPLSRIDQHFLFPSITCNKDNSIEQLFFFLEKMPDNTASIIMLHSVLPEDQKIIRYGKWSHSLSEFEQICAYLSENSKFQVVTNKTLFHYLLQC